MANEAHKRIIPTGLNSQIAYDIIDAVFGQLSDGMWENSPRMDKYWKFGAVRRSPEGKVEVVINTLPYCNNTHNGFYGLPDAAILQFLAAKIKQVIKQELKDNNLTSTMWKRNETSFNTSYLNRMTDINIAQVYFVYETLNGRTNFQHKYNPEIVESVVGSLYSADKAKKIAEVKNAIDAINAKFYAEYKALDEEKRAKIAEIQAKITELEKICLTKREIISKNHRHAIDIIKTENADIMKEVEAA